MTPRSLWICVSVCGSACLILKKIEQMAWFVDHVDHHQKEQRYAGCRQNEAREAKKVRANGDSCRREEEARRYRDTREGRKRKRKRVQGTNRARRLTSRAASKCFSGKEVLEAK
ncbi:uncharacterized protein MEPE_04528 [Melanopsichium pennsylvanicum]|uniref:Uncharacterized protein n=1 Tax=Melanopsichium pennsylvanicum TaxID=63383 RepID=A0AAJ4XNX4_9BASI|nr:uncharacterized protein MEPE_04528 [Melanopsichium pennsylvanicum]